MIKWFAYIVVFLIFTPYLSFSKAKNKQLVTVSRNLSIHLPVMGDDTSTTKNKKQDQEKVKEVTKAKKQPKPEKVVTTDNAGAAKPKQKPKRQRRPEGLERPPEIPRRNGN